MDAWRFLFLLMAINGTLGFRLYSQIHRSPKSVEIAASPVREPASRPTVEERVDDVQIVAPMAVDATTVTLKCVEKSAEHKIKSQTRVVRVLGEWCKLRDVTQLSVENRVNGLEALVFHLPDRRFSTEYLDLQRGINTIVVKALDAKGRSLVSEIQIEY